MSTNIKVLLCSIVIGLVQVIYTSSHPIPGGDWVLVSLGPILYGSTIIPIVFGIAGLILSKERRFFSAFSWFWISFVVIFLLNIISWSIGA